MTALSTASSATTKSTTSSRHAGYAREYETIYVLAPQSNATVEKQVADRVKDAVEKSEGKLLQLENWGRRKLAYEIKRNKRGIFVYARYVGFNDLVPELERNLRLLDPVMRYQTVLLQEAVNIDEVSVEASEVDYAPVEEPFQEEDDATLEETLGMAPARARRQDEGEASRRDDGDAAEAKSAEAAEGAEGDAPAPKEVSAAETTDKPGNAE